MITQDRLKEVLAYNSETGVFTWLVSNCNRIKIGDIAGTEKDGYITIRIDKVSYKAHRLAWLYTYGVMPTLDIDHINHKRYDNSILNLREVTRSENCRNRTMLPGHKTGIYGVKYVQKEKLWYATIYVGTTIHIGCFKNKEDAITARKEAELKYNFHENHGKTEV